MSREADDMTRGEALRDANLRAGLMPNGSKPCSYCGCMPVKLDDWDNETDACADPICQDSSEAWRSSGAFKVAEVVTSAYLEIETAKTVPCGPPSERETA